MNLKKRLFPVLLSMLWVGGTQAASVSLTPDMAGSIRQSFSYQWPGSPVVTSVSHGQGLGSMVNSFTGSGLCGCGYGREDRIYLGFDLTSVGLEVTSAQLTLDITDPGGLYDVDDNLLSIFEVERWSSAQIAGLLYGDLEIDSGSSLFDDLGDGALYSTASLSSGAGLYTFTLSGAAIAELNNDGSFLLGITRNYSDGFFGGDAIEFGGGATLHLEGVSAVPVPAAFWLFASGIAGLVVSRRRSLSRCAQVAP